jgi:zinc-ribbon domain
MFCPKCATPVSSGVKFCRRCGASIALMPQALSDQLPEPSSQEQDRPSLSEFVKMMAGLESILWQFGLLASLFAPRFWWVWLAAPTTYSCCRWLVTLKRGRQDLHQKEQLFCRLNLSGGGAAPSPESSAVGQAVPSANTREFVPPPSITERTTRHLEAEAPVGQVHALPSPNTGELVPPASISEAMTRHPKAEAPTRQG